MTAPLPLANSLHRATIEALRRQAPFSAMGEEELAWLVQQLSVAYYARDAALLEPADAPPNALRHALPSRSPEPFSVRTFS